MLYGLFIVTVAALLALYFFLPNKKVFPYICGALFGVFVISALIQNYYGNEVMTRAQIEELQIRQKVFGDWYANYQKDINRLDLNWQRYYGIVETLKTAEIYEYSTYEQLVDLDRETADEKRRIDSLTVPQELDGESGELLASVIKKTKAYVDAQAKTVSLTKQAANPATVTDLNAMNKRIHEITIRESPAGLFTAPEIAAIRNLLDDKE